MMALDGLEKYTHMAKNGQRLRERLEYTSAFLILNNAKVHRSINKPFTNWLLHSECFFLALFG